MNAVGIIVNPWAGKDVRRLHAPVGQTSDSSKIGIVRRVAIGALDAGAAHVYVAADVSRIAMRAIKGVEGATLVDGPGTGSALDTRRAAGQLVELGCNPIVVLGGDGTSRDAVIGAPEVTLVSISTGTNNVFPRFVDGSSAGTAAGLLASGRVPPEATVRRAKRIVVEIDIPGQPTVADIALVDVAAVEVADAGSRAVVRPSTIAGVVAVIAHPASTGLSAIAGRVHPVSRDEDGGVLVRLVSSTDTGSAHDALATVRHVKVPIVPGHFDVLGIESVTPMTYGDVAEFHGPVMLAYDGERERHVPAGAVARVRVDRLGPGVVDVDTTMLYAAAHHLFDAPSVHHQQLETRHGN